LLGEGTVFHSFTGCDTISGSLGKGKRIAWEAWKSFIDLTAACVDIAMHRFVAVDKSSHKLPLL